MKRIYVAGPYSAPNVMDVFNNMRRGIRKSLDVLLSGMGFSPFCPWLDYHFTLMLRNGEELKVEDYYAYSMAWLEVSDAVLVMEDYEHSKGTMLEIARATELEIPVYYSIDALKRAQLS